MTEKYLNFQHSLNKRFGQLLRQLNPLFSGHGAIVTELKATKTENGQLKQKVETLEKEKFLLKQKLEQTEAKLKAALEKAEEKTKDKVWIHGHVSRLTDTMEIEFQLHSN